MSDFCPLCDKPLLKVKYEIFNVYYCEELLEEDYSLILSNRGTPGNKPYHYSIKYRLDVKTVENILFKASAINIFKYVFDFYKFDKEQKKFVHHAQINKKDFNPTVGPSIVDEILNYLIIS